MDIRQLSVSIVHAPRMTGHPPAKFYVEASVAIPRSPEDHIVTARVPIHSIDQFPDAIVTVGNLLSMSMITAQKEANRADSH